MENEIGWLLKEKYFGKPNKNFYKDIERLKAGEPVDYVIGFTKFLSCKIYLSNKPLIPRPETEFWVGQELAKIKRGRVLDIFSGSGCIGIAILKHNKSLLCDFSDKDKNSVKQIKINLKKNNVKGRVIKSDIFSNIKNKYDFIFANPPYIPTTKRDKVGKSVLKFEPKTALFGGQDGLYYIKKFLKQAKSHLNYGGTIFMEFSPEQKPAIGKLVEKYGYKSCQFYKDQFNRWRWVSVK